jgi:hypothetical protein
MIPQTGVRSNCTTIQENDPAAWLSGDSATAEIRNSVIAMVRTSRYLLDYHPVDEYVSHATLHAVQLARAGVRPARVIRQAVKKAVNELHVASRRDARVRTEWAADSGTLPHTLPEEVNDVDVIEAAVETFAREVERATLIRRVRDVLAFMGAKHPATAEGLVITLAVPSLARLHRLTKVQYSAIHSAATRGREIFKQLWCQFAGQVVPIPKPKKKSSPKPVSNPITVQKVDSYTVVHTPSTTGGVRRRPSGGFRPSRRLVRQSA